MCLGYLHRSQQQQKTQLSITAVRSQNRSPGQRAQEPSCHSVWGVASPSEGFSSQVCWHGLRFGKQPIRAPASALSTSEARSCVWLCNTVPPCTEPHVKCSSATVVNRSTLVNKTGLEYPCRRKFHWTAPFLEGYWCLVGIALILCLNL